MIDTDASSNQKERKLLTDTQHPETVQTPEDVIQKNVLSALSEKFLGERARNTSYAHESFLMRQIIRDKLQDKPVDKAAIVKAAEQSPLLEKRQQILDERLTTEDLSHITELNKRLAADPKLLASIRNGLYEFQFKRLDELHIPTDQIKQNLDHIQRVVQYVEQADTASTGPDNPLGLAILTAAVHDIEKVANYSYLVKNQDTRTGASTLLAEHEYMSAILGKEVVQEALKAAGLEKYAASAAKLVGKAILPHGEGEWPERQAQMAKLPATMALDDKEELYLLLGGLFIKSPSSSEIPIVADEVTADTSEEARQAERMCRSTIEAVSAADKMDGLGDLSLVKYHQGNSIQYIFTRSSSHEYAQTFAETLVYNMRNAPDVLGIKQNPKVQDTINRAGLLFSIMQDVESHPALSELSVAAGHEIPDFLPPYSDILGSDVAKGLIIKAIEMRELFHKAKSAWDTDTQHAAHMTDDGLKEVKQIQREKRAIKSKQEYGDRLEQLVTELIALGPLQLEGNQLGDKISSTLTSLDNHFR